ncbi:MAG TPA: CdaR family protein [Burkholderiales bacterium]|nr:CdaR family protein [Burkholderiales bacterium]
MKGYVRGLVVRNWSLKLVSIVLALALWLVLVPADKILSEKTVTVPLEVRDVPENMEVVERSVSTVDVTVRAPSRILDQITPSTLAARLNLERATVYQLDYPLNKSIISLPLGADVIEVRPSKAQIRLEPTKEVTLDVHASVRGKVAAGFRIAKIEVDPKVVSVSGPESKVRIKDAVTTAPVDVTGLDRTREFEVDLILPRPELRLVSARTSAIVTVTIEPDRGNGRGAAPRQK